MEQQTTYCKIGSKLEGVFKPFGVEMYTSKFGELGKMVFDQKFHKLGKMLVDQAIADVGHRSEGDKNRQQAHEWMGNTSNSVGSFAYWLNPTTNEDALAILDDDERRVLSAVLDPKFRPTVNENCSRERFRQVKDKVLRKLRTLN